MFCNRLDTQLVTSIENKMNISNTSKKGEIKNIWCVACGMVKILAWETLRFSH